MNRRGTYRGIYSSLFDNPDYQNLTSNARLVLLTARLCKLAGAAVIFRYYPSVLAAQTGLHASSVNAAIKELAAAGWIEVEAGILWVKNALRYDPIHSLSDKKHQISVLRGLAELPRAEIVLRFCDYYHLPRAFDGACASGFRFSSETETETETETEKETPPTPPARGASFEEFWKAYPRHESRKGAEEQWQRLKVTPDLLQTMLGAIDRQKQSPQWRDGKIVYAVRWLRDRRWEDEPFLPGAGSQNGYPQQVYPPDMRTKEERDADLAELARIKAAYPQRLRPSSGARLPGSLHGGHEAAP